MPFERWKQLSDPAKKTWDMISEKEKAIILGYAANGPSSPQRQAHVHEESSSEEIFQVFLAGSLS
eukprot:scaffold14715_cov146-Amphora_coffeaeformis.AAC.1